MPAAWGSEDDEPAGARDAHGLIERGRELEAIALALAGARAGTGRVLLIEGPAGIGKSRLLRAAGAEAELAGMSVLAAQGLDFERDGPFGVAIDLFATPLAGATRRDRDRLLAGQAAHAAALFGDGPGVAGGPDATVRGLYWLAANLAEDDDGGAVPLVLLVDDAQWCDAPSFAFLAHLAARLEGLSIALLVAGRDDEPALRRVLPNPLLATGEAAVIRPLPLSDDGVDELVGREFEAPDPRFLAACRRVAAGNPFVARELVRALRAEGIAPAAASAAAVERLLPETVLHSILGRLARLGPDAAAVAGALAVLGAGSPLRRVTGLTGLSAQAAEAAADELAAAGLVEPGEPLRFTHPLIATAVHDDLPAYARARRHRDAAELLRAEAAPLPEIASHLLAARPEGDAWVVATLREMAAAAVAGGDPAAATRLLARALAEPPPVASRGELLLELAEAEVLAGDVAAADHVAAGLVAVGPGEGRERALLALARIRIAAGEQGRAAAALEEVLGDLAPEDPRAQRVFAEYLTAVRFRAPLRDAARDRLEALAEAVRGGEPPSDPSLLAHAVLSLALAGESPPTVLAPAQRAAAVDDADDLAALGMPRALLVQALCCVDRLDEAEEIAIAALAAARRGGSFIATTVGSFHRAIPLYYRGRLADAMAELDQAQATRREGWDAAVAWPLALQANVQIECGELDAAAASLAGLEIAAESMDRAMVLSARARLALARREPEAAQADAEAVGQLLDTRFEVDHPGLVPWRRTAALAALGRGDRARAEELAEAALRRSREVAVPRAIAMSLRTVATVRGELGPLEEAAATIAKAPSRLERAHVLFELGAALRRDGRRVQAREPLREALELADRMGATPLAAAARGELHAAGVRPRRAALSGVASLTPAELRVARLAAEGLTNREVAQSLFVTAKTVQTHLSSVYRKLDVTSRRDLPSALAGPED